VKTDQWMNPATSHRDKIHRLQLNPGQELGHDGQRPWLDNDKLLASGTVGRYIDELIATGSGRTPSSSSAPLTQNNDSLRAHLVAGVRHACPIGIFEPTLDSMRRKHFERAAHLRRRVARQATAQCPSAGTRGRPDANAKCDRAREPARHNIADTRS